MVDTTSNKQKKLKATPEDRLNRGKRIRFLREALRYSTRKFEAKHGISASTIKNWEQGKAGGLTADGALKLISAFQQEGANCTFEWLFYGIGEAPNVVVPFDTHLTEIAPPLSAVAQELSLFHQLHPNAIDAIVSDNSMEPCFYKGDYVAGIRYFEDKIETLIGKQCIVQLQTGEIDVCQLNKGNHKGSYTLSWLNPAVKPAPLAFENILLFSAARIIWRRCPES